VVSETEASIADADAEMSESMFDEDDEDNIIYGKLVSVAKDGSDKDFFPLAHQHCDFGKGADCDIIIHREDVSKLQCRIEFLAKSEGGNGLSGSIEATLLNMNPSLSNPTLLNGLPVSNKMTTLSHKDLITVGGRDFRVELNSTSHHKFEDDTLSSSSQTPTSSSQTPISNSQTPSSNSQTPTSNTQTPTSNSQIPTSNSQTPSSSSKTPTNSSQISTRCYQIQKSSFETPISSFLTPSTSSSNTLKHKRSNLSNE